MNDRVTIVGAGNGGVAAAAELTLLGHEVCLFNRTQSRLDPFEKMGGVHLINEGGDRGIVPISHMTTNIGEALNGSRVVIVMVPTSGLGYYAAEMSPDLRKGHSVLLAPGHTGGALLFRRVVESAGGEIPGLVGETNTLPYICRMTGTAEVTVWRHSQALLTATLPATETEDFCELASSLLRENGVIAASSVLETSLSNYNAVMHPAGMILNAGWIENPDEQFRYYSQGHGPAIGRVIAAVDSERIEIGTRLDIELLPFLDSFYRSGYTTEEAWKSGSVDLAITESGPNREIVAPSSLQDRYVEEDIGFGLVPMMEIAAVVDVKTPAIASLIALAEIATGDDYGVKGLSAASMGIDSMTSEQLLTYVSTGK